MQSAVRILMAMAAILTLSACDPVYRLGVRQQLAPGAIESCLASALQSSPRRSDFQELTPRAGRGFRFVMLDSTLARGGLGGTLVLWAGGDSVRTLELTTSWMGGPRTYPVATQRRMVALMTSVLDDLRQACAPTAPAHIECFAQGVGGAPACRSAA